MRKATWLAVVTSLLLILTGGVANAFQEEIIWDPNDSLGEFTDPPSNFDDILDQLDDPATVTVSGGGNALKSTVNGISSGEVIEITDSATYNGGITITDKTNIVIRAEDGESPVVDCGVLSQGQTCLSLNATSNRSVSDIAVKGLEFKDIRTNASGSASTAQGIASFSGHLLENVVIADNTFDNSDPNLGQSFKGAAIHLNKIDGLLVRRNTIVNGALTSGTSVNEDGAITIHEFLRSPNHLNNVFIQNNEVLFDYDGVTSPPSGNTRGIVLSHTPVPAGTGTARFHNVVVEYNLIDNVQKEGIKIYGDSTDTNDDQTANIQNNVIKRTDNGIEVDDGTAIIDHTIIDGTTSFGAQGKDEGINADGGTTTVSNTIVTNKTKGVTDSDTVTLKCIDLFNPSGPHPTSDVSGTIHNVDPMFIDPANNDYRIGNSEFPQGCAGGDFGLNLIPPVIQVDLDIKPGSDPNSINCNNDRGVIAVAILTTDDFDATTVDHTTVTFEGAEETHVDRRTGEPRRHEEDVDGDADTDLVFHFRLGDTGLTCDAEEGTLEGETFDGDAIEGTDSVRMIDHGGGQP